MTNKKLGLLLLPLVPLSALGIVSIVDRALPSAPSFECAAVETVYIEVPRNDLPPAPVESAPPTAAVSA